MIEDLKRSVFPSKYKDLLVKSRMNCFKFSLKVFFTFLAIFILLNFPNLITMNYKIENFVENIHAINFELDYDERIDPLIEKNSQTINLENSSYISNTYKYDFEVISGDIEFNEYDHNVNESSMNKIESLSKNKLSNFFYALYLLLIPGVLLVLSIQSFIVIYLTIGFTFIVVSVLTHVLKFNEMTPKRCLKITLLASPILIISILANYIFRLHMINFMIIAYWVLVGIVVWDLSTLKNHQRKYSASHVERRKFLELNLVRYYDAVKLEELEKSHDKWHNKIKSTLEKSVEDWKSKKQDNEKWVDYKKEDDPNN